MSAELSAVGEGVTIDVLVSRYVEVRDRIKEADKAHKDRMAPARELLDQLNNALLAELNRLKGESVRTSFGTVYRTSRKSATITDGDVFRKWVIQNEEWDLVDWRANATATFDYVQNYENPPPGVNFTQHFEVGVRRS